MGLKEQYENYKQRQDAKNYFRQNNDTLLTGIDMIKAVVVGILVASVCGYVLMLVLSGIGVNLSIFELAIGYAVAYALKKVTGKSGVTLGAIAVICYFVGIVIGYVLYFIMQLTSLGIPFSMLFMPGITQILQLLFGGDVITTLFYIAGAVVAYWYAKD